MADPVAGLLKALETVAPQQVYLVHGDLTLAEPAARRLAAAIAGKAGCSVDEKRHPARLSPIFEDLRTYSLFEPAKVVLVVDSSVCADRNAAAALIDQVDEVLPLSGGELSNREREAASRLLQTLRLFDIDPAAGGSETVVAQLPDWALAGAKGKGQGRGKSRSRSRTKAQKNQLAQELGKLLSHALDADLAGWADSELSQLSELVQDGLPKDHALILAERIVAKGHPLLQALEERRAVAFTGDVASERSGGWSGLGLLAEELQRETGSPIDRDALAELARRTLRQQPGWGNKATDGAQAESTARLAGEYRKLANLAHGRAIDRQLVEQVVLDRGQEDVWKILDAIGEGKAKEALGRLRRYLGTGEDPVAIRLSFFSLLAGFCRQLTAVRGMMRAQRIPGGERNYGRFKSSHAPALQGALKTGGKNPLAGIHPFRLHRAYVAASRLPERELNQLPWRVLETELLLKGEGTDADAAIQQLIVRLAS